MPHQDLGVAGSPQKVKGYHVEGLPPVDGDISACRAAQRASSQFQAYALAERLRLLQSSGPNEVLDDKGTDLEMISVS